MPSGLSQGVLFISSFSPLLAVFALLQTFGKGWPSWLCLFLAVASAVSLAVFLRVARSLTPASVVVARARHRDLDAIGYVATYLLPFAALPGDNWRARAAVLVFLAVVAILYMRAFLFYVNPLLSLVGYRLFEIETEHGRTLLLISRRKFVAGGSTVSVRTLSDYVFIEA